MAWTRLSPGGPQPHVRCSHIAAAAGPNKLLVVGGAFYGSSGGLEMLGDAFVYDGDADAWEKVRRQGTRPRRLGCAAAGQAGRGGPRGALPAVSCPPQAAPSSPARPPLSPARPPPQVTPEGGKLPSPRNAAIGVPLSDCSGPADAGGALELLIHGGWRAFVETYNDTFILSMD
jgi:hypothetical protein